MKCPNCPEAKEGKCCHWSCDQEIPAEEQELQSNPYAAEINDDETLHLECANCRYESAMDI